MICQYCGNEAKQVTGDVIYTHRKDLEFLKFYHCSDCDAFVGCHKKDGSPLGTLANKELREWRKLAHFAFDDMWIGHGCSARKDAYKWMSDTMKLHKNDAHIAMLSIDQCRQLIDHVSNFYQNNK